MTERSHSLDATGLHARLLLLPRRKRAEPCRAEMTLHRHQSILRPIVTSIYQTPKSPSRLYHPSSTRRLGSTNAPFSIRRQQSKGYVQIQNRATWNIDPEVQAEPSLHQHGNMSAEEFIK
jgi:hypothetical protein